tara:strand:- start:14910 stop:16637 length:1728 start_codon:yes stop_codon:yes gene_type:complete
MDDKDTVKLCITMAGAVSAGAYTAGVLDYLLDTLALWEAAKEKNRKLGPEHPKYDHSIPMHQVEIDVLSGSSAGGISCTLMLLALADKKYRSFGSRNELGENNVFYQSWVHMADDEHSDTLEKLLQIDDLKKYKSVHSLLNTLPIEEIADTALNVKEPRVLPKFASDSLDVILTTTNLRGLNFQVNFDELDRSGSKGTIITNHGGFFRYKLTNEKFKTGIPEAEEELYYVLDLQDDKHVNYLKNATLSTAAFPVGLESREMKVASEYIQRYPKYLFNESAGITALIPDGDTYSFTSVDGGVINNEPYGIGLRILKEKNPEHCNNEKYAVIMVDPFPNKDTDVPHTGKGIFATLSGLFKALRNQVMFNQDGIIDALDTSDRTKFLIEPIRKIEKDGDWVRPKSDLASSPIAGFAGFINSEFRKHDFQLGRKNCQNFLRYHFAVAEENVAKRLSISLPEDAKKRFEFALPPKDPNGKKFFPFIPDVRVKRSFDEQLDVATFGEDAKITLFSYPSVSFKDFEKRYKKKIKNRIGYLVKYMVNSSVLSGLANFFYTKRAGYRFVKDSLERELRDNDLLR